MKKQTLNKDGTPRKTGSGRTKGAASTILVKLSDVNKEQERHPLGCIIRFFVELQFLFD